MKTLTKFIAPFYVVALLLTGCAGENADHAEMEGHDDAMAEAEAEAPEEYSGPNADLVAEFNHSEEVLKAALEGVHGDQWTFHESPDRWNIAEIVEHIIVAEKTIAQGFVGGLVAGEANAEDTGNYAEADSGVRMMIRDRSNALQAPDAIQPQGIYATPEAALAAFDSTRAQTLEFIKNTDVDLRTHVGSLAPGAIPDMDAYQWLLFAAGHVERHTAQIEQVKADPNYPAM